MNMKEIRARGKDVGVVIRIGVTKIEAVRAIQRAEGFEDCFGRGKYNVCGQAQCMFREDCSKINP